MLDSPVNIGALAERVRRQWAVPVRNGWELETESGYLSAERLSLLVTSPQERNVFKQERYQPEMSAAVSILLDCSGSMRNQLPRVLPMVEVLTRVFERAGVQTEVLVTPPHLGTAAKPRKRGSARDDLISPALG